MCGRTTEERRAGGQRGTGGGGEGVTVFRKNITHPLIKTGKQTVFDGAATTLNHFFLHRAEKAKKTEILQLKSAPALCNYDHQARIKTLRLSQYGAG